MRITEEIDIAAQPADVWGVAGRLGDVAAWIPSLESSRLAGDVRHVSFIDDGGEARERIVAVDDRARTYTYEYLDGPLALESYVATFTVHSAGTGSRVVWAAEFAAASEEIEQQLASGIGGIYRDALTALADRVAGVPQG